MAVERLERTRTRFGCIWCFRSGCVLVLGCIWMHWVHWMVGYMHVLGHQLCYSIYRVDGSHKWLLCHRHLAYTVASEYNKGITNITNPHLSVYLFIFDFLSPLEKSSISGELGYCIRHVHQISGTTSSSFRLPPKFFCFRSSFQHLGTVLLIS